MESSGRLAKDCLCTAGVSPAGSEKLFVIAPSSTAARGSADPGRFMNIAHGSELELQFQTCCYTWVGGEQLEAK